MAVPAMTSRSAPVPAFIGAGSNIDPEHHLPQGVGLLAEHVRITRCSGVYRTPPWGMKDQPAFLNAVIRVETQLAPLHLLDVLQQIESACGRERTVPNGPRTLDLDLLLYGDRIIAEDRLRVPHSRMHQRGFVLVPLCDLAPEMRHPEQNQSMRELMQGVDRAGIERVSLEWPSFGETGEPGVDSRPAWR